MRRNLINRKIAGIKFTAEPAGEVLQVDLLRFSDDFRFARGIEIWSDYRNYLLPRQVLRSRS